MIRLYIFRFLFNCWRENAQYFKTARENYHTSSQHWENKTMKRVSCGRKTSLVRKYMVNAIFYVSMILFCALISGTDCHSELVHLVNSSFLFDF